MIGGGVRATRGARSEVGPSSSRRDPGPGCVCAPLAACRTLPLPARLRLKRPSDARSAERGEGVRATRGARSEVGSCLAPRSRPWLRTGFLPYTLPLLARLRLKRPSDARSAERGDRVSERRAERGVRWGLPRAAMPALAACAPQASCRTLPLLARLRFKRPSDARGAR